MRTLISPSSFCFSSMENGRLDAEQVGEPARLAGVHRGDLQLLGDLLALVDHPLEQAVDVMDQGVELDPFLDPRPPAARPRPIRYGSVWTTSTSRARIMPLADDPGRAVGELEHLQDRPDADGRVQVVLPRVVGLGVELAGQADSALADQDLVDQPDPAGAVDHQRDDRLRKDHIGPQRQERDPVGHRTGLPPLGQDQHPPRRRRVVRGLPCGSVAGVRAVGSDVGATCFFGRMEYLLCS